MKTVKWGIVSTGNIADKFSNSLRFVDGAVIEAVASRNDEKAKAFAQKYGANKYYSSYEQMSTDPEIDIVYIGTPNNLHYENALMFMEQGKSVLCEKPLAANEAQVRAMIEKAEKSGVFFMEGMWTRFFPAIKKALEWVKDGSIGQPRTLFANFGIDTSENKEAWRYSRKMAGGAMMDVGIYPLALAFAAFGTNYSDIYSTAVLENGVDVTNTVTLKYPDGKIAVIGSSFNAIMNNKVLISGSEGGIRIGENCDWWHPDRASLLEKKDEVAEYALKETFKQPYETIGFQYEAKAVQDYFLAGAQQAEEMTWEDSIKISATIDKLRKMWGVVYDEDKSR